MLQGKTDLGHSHTSGQKAGGAVEMGGICCLDVVWTVVVWMLLQINPAFLNAMVKF